MENKIIFNSNQSDNLHYRKLKALLKDLVKNLPEKREYQKKYIVIALLILYFLIYFLSLTQTNHIIIFYFLFALLGITSVLIFLNIIHEAVHSNVFKKRWLNKSILIVFDLLGGNSFIWGKRHMLLHHNFQNISGWDSDIEQSGPIKIFPHAKTTILHKYQHWLIFLFYPLYLFNWILVRDFKDFFLKKRMIKKVCKIPTIEYFKLFFFKILFVFYILIIPILLGVKWYVALGALFIMLITGSVFALLVLLTPHVNDKNQFPQPDSNGVINNSWFEHQFNTTNDISINNWFTRNVMGNFNFHLSHHLFPNISSVYAPEITKVIKEYANEHGFKYRSYRLREALFYHYKLIKANTNEFDLFEEDM